MKRVWKKFELQIAHLAFNFVFGIWLRFEALRSIYVRAFSLIPAYMVLARWRYALMRWKRVPGLTGTEALQSLKIYMVNCGEAPVPAPPFLGSRSRLPAFAFRLRAAPSLWLLGPWPPSAVGPSARVPRPVLGPGPGPRPRLRPRSRPPARYPPTNSPFGGHLPPSPANGTELACHRRNQCAVTGTRVRYSTLPGDFHLWPSTEVEV